MKIANFEEILKLDKEVKRFLVGNTNSPPGKFNSLLPRQQIQKQLDELEKKSEKQILLLKKMGFDERKIRNVANGLSSLFFKKVYGKKTLTAIAPLDVARDYTQLSLNIITFRQELQDDTKKSYLILKFYSDAFSVLKRDGLTDILNKNSRDERNKIAHQLYWLGKDHLVLFKDDKKTEILEEYHGKEKEKFIMALFKELTYALQLAWIARGLALKKHFEILLDEPKLWNSK